MCCHTHSSHVSHALLYDVAYHNNRRRILRLLLKPVTIVNTIPHADWHSERRTVDFNWGNEKIRGVNIGGWLVLEP